MANELEHFGIQGMHWGIHRSRPDTSSPDHKMAREIKGKKLSEMSNAELKTLTTRLNLEKQYKDLTKNEVSFGSKLASQALSLIGTVAVSQITSIVSKQINQVVQDLIDKKGK